MASAPIRPFADRRVVLGITGGIAAYKAAWLARLLALAGAEVDVVMSRAAQEFVGSVTFQALTGRPVSTELFGDHALDHIRIAQGADAVVIAPATADFLARAAHGHADDLLTAVLLATKAPVLVVPAMNDRMWAHPQTTRNVAHLREIGYRVLDPDDGMLAAGEGSGPGRMPEPETIFAHVARLLEPANGALAGKRIVVTAGPTRESVDPVRFLSNRSSGKMGVALAGAAWRRGADVRLIAGPISVEAPPGVAVTNVETTDDMQRAVAEELQGADVLIMAAAPADFRPSEPAGRKLKKSAALRSIPLEETPDILQTTRDARPRNAVIVGFALETDNALANAQGKLEAKGLDMVVLNDATEEGAGFSVDTNRVTILTRKGAAESLPLMSKDAVADAILDRVEGLL
jgi:phosphopantothenoylcysteine decarboxylase / phosphopantothenate---cysteine ligase